jgi:hypothetical protein
MSNPLRWVKCWCSVYPTKHVFQSGDRPRLLGSISGANAWNPWWFHLLHDIMKSIITLALYRSSLLACLSLCSLTQVLAGGKLVNIVLKDSAKVTGELLAVHDSSLILCREPWLSERKLESHPDTLIIVALDDILWMHVGGHRNPFLGAGVGAAAGLVVGALLGSRTNDTGIPGNVGHVLGTQAGGLLGIIGGFFAGLIVGSFVETGARDINPFQESQASSLSQDARYQQDEPEFIKHRGAQ